MVLAVDGRNFFLLHTSGRVLPSYILHITSIFCSNVIDLCDSLGTFSHSRGFTALLLLDMAAFILVI